MEDEASRGRVEGNVFPDARKSQKGYFQFRFKSEQAGQVPGGEKLRRGASWKEEAGLVSARSTVVGVRMGWSGC